jgi:hypothetical protein
VPLDDALDVGQPKPGAFKFIMAMKPLKYAEQLVGEVGIETRTVVADENRRSAIFKKY